MVLLRKRRTQPIGMQFRSVKLQTTPRVDLGGRVAFADLEGVGAKCLPLSGN